MSIEYRVNAPVDAETFIALLKVSTLAERRPVEDRNCIEGMLRHSDLTVTAWHDQRLVGIAHPL